MRKKEKNKDKELNVETKTIEKKEKKNSKEKVSKKEKENIASVNNCIPYDTVCNNGIFKVDNTRYSKSYIIPEVNFVTLGDADQESIAEAYTSFLNTFEAGTNIQITLHNRTVDMDDFEANVLLQSKFDGLDEFRKEFNNMILQKLSEGRNNLITDKYLTITISAADIYEATGKFEKIDETVNENIIQITKKSAKSMSTVERLQVLNQIYNPDALSLTEEIVKDGKTIKAFSLENCAIQGITTKDVIAPSSFTFPMDQKKLSMVGSRYVKSFYISSWPTWIKGTLLTDFADISTNSIISTHFEPIDQGDAIKYVRAQGNNVSANIIKTQKRSRDKGYDSSLISPGDQNAKDEISELLEIMRKDNVRLFNTSFIITLFADDENSMKDYETQLKMIANKNLVSIHPYDLQQEQALASVVPVGNNKVSIKRQLTSLTLASINPFKVKEINQEGGMYIGQNAYSKNIVLYNRSLDDINPNACILGMPGAGKSFAAKREIDDVALGTNDEIYIIDPENEYKEQAKAFGGSFIKIANDGTNFINPFDLNIDNEGEDGDPIKVKSAFIQGVIEVMAGGRRQLTEAELSIIDRVTIQIYDDYLKHLKKTGKRYDREAAPTLKDFYNKLRIQDQAEAINLSLALEKYVEGTSDIFSHHTNVDITNRITVFDIKDITGNLRNVALNICLDHIWNKMIENHYKGKNTWIYIDEFHLLMENPATSAYIAQIWKRARKWHGIPCAMTQNVEDMLNNHDARTVINNCSFIMLLKQSPVNKLSLSEMFGISSEEQKYISSSKPGRGLVWINGDFIPIDDSFPTDTKLYKIMTTKASERMR